MESPTLPAIDSNAIDECIFDNKINIEAAGFGVDDVDKEEINLSMANTISDDDDINKETSVASAIGRTFPPRQTLLYGDNTISMS